MNSESDREPCTGSTKLGFCDRSEEIIHLGRYFGLGLKTLAVVFLSGPARGTSSCLERDPELPAWAAVLTFSIR